MRQIYSIDDVSSSINHVTSTLSELMTKITGATLLTQRGQVLIHTRLQTLFNLKFESEIDRSIFNIIVEHAIAAEKFGSGGFDICIRMLLKKLNDHKHGVQHLDAEKKSGDIVGAGAAFPTKSDINWLINERMSLVDDKTRLMFNEALNLAGFGGRIAVEKARNDPTVELVCGYTFEQSPIWPISIRLERPRIVCIDGFIESVSELNNFLEEAAQTKESTLLFARGMSDDVKHTIRVNYDRGTLRVIPVIVRFDLEGINSINDISVVTGSKIVSSNTGDLITNVRLCDASIVDEAIIYPDRVVITNSKTRSAVSSHVEFLRKKRQGEKIEDVESLIDARIRSLSPNYVVMRLKDDRNYVIAAQSIDYSLRAIRSLVDYGTVMLNGVKMLTTTAIASTYHSTKCYHTLMQIGAVIKP